MKSLQNNIYLFVKATCLLIAILFVFCTYAQTGKDNPFASMPDTKEKVDSILAWNENNRKNPSREAIYKDAFGIVDELNYKEAKPALYNSYGVYLRDISKYTESINWHLKALEFSDKTGDVKEKIKAYNNLGVAYRRMDDYIVALDYLEEAWRLSEKAGDDYSMTVALNSIGNIHFMQKDYKSAIGYFKQCMPIAVKAGNDRGLAINMQNIGECYQNLGLLDSASYYFTTALDYNKKRNDEKGIAICYNSIGNLLVEKGEIEKALDLFKKALAINRKLGDKIFIATSFNNIASALLLQNDYMGANRMFDSSLEIANSIGSVSEAKDAYEGLMKSAQAKKDWEKAFLYSSLYKKFSDSLINSKTTQTLRGKEVAYHERKIALLESNSKNNRIIMVGSLILFLLLLISGLLYYLRNRLLERNRRLQRELEIRSQIASDLHDDMGSSLSSIHIFSELLRKKGHDSDELLTKIEANAKDTLEALDDIIWLVKPSNDKFSNLSTHIREFAVPLFESKNIHFEIDFPDSIPEVMLPMEVRRNVFLIIKESVNNLVKYSDCTQATIKATYEAGDLVFVVKDNGKGFDPEMETNRNGVKNLKARAASINAHLVINSTPEKGTEIILITKAKENSVPDNN